jgi:adenylate cyclase
MKLPKKLSNFLILHFVHGWQIRVLHVLLCLALYFLFKLDFFRVVNATILQQIQKLFAENDFILTITQALPEDFEILFSLTLASTSILFFNFFYTFKSIKLQIVVYLIKLVIINFLGLYILTQTGYSYPFLGLNMFAFIEAQFSSAAKLARVLAEYNFVRKTFGKFVDRNALDDFMIADQSFLSESKVMSVMFTDIRGFSTLAEGMGANELVKLLNRYFDEMSKVVYIHNGSVDKFIGDSVMAVWNGSTPEKKHAAQSVLTAMKMVKKLNQLKKENQAFEIFNMGIGVHTGEMIFGAIGGNSKFDYTVFGDNVNLASRLEGLNKKYQTTIICSQATVNACRKSIAETVIFRKLDTIIVKGKSESTSIYQPLSFNQRNQKLKQTYEIGLDLYQRGSFDQALPYFHELVMKGDRPSHVILGRIQKLLRDPPQFWNGVYTWKDK